MEVQRFDILCDMIIAAKKNLPPSQPLHLFGAGHPAIFPFIVALGCDLFDSAAYALYARMGRYLSSDGTQELDQMEEFSCQCRVCDHITPDDMRCLDPADRERLLSQHNLLACFSELRRIREAIRKGRLWDLLEYRASASPSFKKFLARIVHQSPFLEQFTPAVKPRGISHLGETSDHRPEMIRNLTRKSWIPVERNRAVVLLPGRWRRPYHEDPRNMPIVGKLLNRPDSLVWFYTIPFGPVPAELDETFPLAQTESFDDGDPANYETRAVQVAISIRRLSPKRVIILCEGDYGKTVAKELARKFSKGNVVIIPISSSIPKSVVARILRALS